jgi:hypothetical protein
MRDQSYPIVKIDRNLQGHAIVIHESDSGYLMHQHVPAICDLCDPKAFNSEKFRIIKDSPEGIQDIWNVDDHQKASSTVPGKNAPR